MVSNKIVLIPCIAIIIVLTTANIVVQGDSEFETCYKNTLKIDIERAIRELSHKVSRLKLSKKNVAIFGSR